MAETARRGLLLRWWGWFVAANAAVLGFVGLAYVGFGALGGGALAWTYLVTIMVSHHAVLAFLALLPVAVVALIVPRWGVVTALGVVAMAAAIALYVLDSLLWNQSRFHLNALTMQILGAKSWIFAGAMLVIGLVFEALLARRVRAFVEARARRRGAGVGVALFLCLLVAQGLHAWADAAYYVPVTRLSNQLPVHAGVTAKSFFARTGWVDIAQSRERALAERLAEGEGAARGSGLDYPKAPLACPAPSGLNLLVIMVDALRAEVIDPETSPAVLAWAERSASRFEKHLSGGNSSRAGTFSFFYGLPPSYFAAFEAAQRPAVLVEELQRQAYDLGVFSAATLVRPVALDRTAFASVPDLRLATEPEDDPSWKRDRRITRDWIAWLDARPGDGPFFGFLFYDTPNARDLPPAAEFPRLDAPPGHPMREAFAEYRTAVRHTDRLIGEVLDDLERRGLAGRTVVMITADHGEEFNESGEGFDEHGSGFSDYQLHVPMWVAWPGREPRVYTHRSSHYDVVPTLLGGVLGCENPASDYAVGRNLYDGEDWPWLVAGSYANYAVVEPGQVTVTFPNGRYEVRDRDYRLLEAPRFDGDVLEAVMRENARFVNP